jgi:hypothetical protein
MLKSVKIVLQITILMALSTLPLLSGCKGSDTREKVDDTVETLAGKKQVDQMKKAEKDISDITNKQAERFDQFEEDSEEEE